MLVVAAIAALIAVAEVLILLRESHIIAMVPSSSFTSLTPTPNDSLLKKVFTLEGLFFFFTSVGLAMVSLHEYDNARWCFFAAGVVFALAVVSSVDKRKLVVGFLCAVVVGIAVNGVNDWVTRLEIAEIVKNGQNDIERITDKVRARAVPPHEEQKNHPDKQGRPADLISLIVNPTSPQLLIWPLGAVARNVEGDPLLWDIDRNDRISSDSLIINQMKYDWIRPDQHAGPTSLLDSRDIQSVVKPGHRIFGYLTITCPDCDRVRLYWIYFVYGQGGWFAEVPKGVSLNPKAIGDSIPLLREDNALEQYLAHIPQISRIPIGEMQP